MAIEAIPKTNRMLLDDDLGADRKTSNINGLMLDQYRFPPI